MSLSSVILPASNGPALRSLSHLKTETDTFFMMLFQINVKLLDSV
jgi:hypothetical protein